MTLQGTVLIDIAGLALIVLIINLVRTHKLYVGYALIWLLSVVGLMIIVSYTPLLVIITRAVGALFPVSALSLLAFVFIVLALIFFSVQLSILQARVVEIAQFVALSKSGGQKEEGRNGNLFDQQ